MPFSRAFFIFCYAVDPRTYPFRSSLFCSESSLHFYQAPRCVPSFLFYSRISRSLVLFALEFPPVLFLLYFQFLPVERLAPKIVLSPGGVFRWCIVLFPVLSLLCLKCSFPCSFVGFLFLRFLLFVRFLFNFRFLVSFSLELRSLVLFLLYSHSLYLHVNRLASHTRPNPMPHHQPLISHSTTMITIHQ